MAAKKKKTTPSPSFYVSDIIDRAVALTSEVNDLKEENTRLKAKLDWKPINDAPINRVILTDKGFVVRAKLTVNGKDLGWCLCDKNGELTQTFVVLMKRRFATSISVVRYFLIKLGIRKTPKMLDSYFKETRTFLGICVNPNVWKDIM